MNFKSISDLACDIRTNIHKIPSDVTLIVGIPRSGLLAANLISLYLNLPFTDIDSFLQGQIISTGKRGEISKLNALNGKILIVDDSVCTGSSINDAKKKLLPIKDIYDFLYCSVYILPGCEMLVDINFAPLEAPRVFEWNIFHHSVLNNSCVDIDGVLCFDPTDDENDDGRFYIDFLITAKPLILPGVKIKTLVTCRLEKYRNETVKWLEKHNVQYEELVMLNLPNMAARIQLGCHADFKASAYEKRQDCFLFIESSRTQAESIHQLTGKSVYCVETNQMFSKNVPLLNRVFRKSYRKISLLKKKLKTIKKLFTK